MEQKINVTIDGVQATMLLPLRGRAKLSSRFPELYKNDSDLKMIDKLAYDFTSIDQALGEYGNLTYVVRAKKIEQMITKFLTAKPKAAVVNVGAGLDNLFDRVDNGLVNWYDLDLPDSMAFRKLLIEDQERAHSIAKSVFDFSWFDDLSYSPDDGLLIVAGGVFHFLPEEQLKELMIRLSERFSKTEVFFDINSKEGNLYSNESIKASGNQGAPLIFAVDQKEELEAWSPRIKVLSISPYFDKIPRYEDLEAATKQFMDLADQKGICKFIHLQL